MTGWYLLRSPADEAAMNMAIDEALLLIQPHLRAPVLRFYSWTEPAASFGYFQKFAHVASATHLRPLIRRPTAGGIVPHDADWTYSLAIPTCHEWYGVRAIESYRRIHAWICAAFARLQIDTKLALSSSKIEAGQCFVGYEQHDLLWRSRKIAGAAQRRTKDGFLIQGSVQPPESWSRIEWENAMCEIAKQQGVRWVPLQPDDVLKQLSEQLARQKYSQEQYNRKR